MQSGYFFIGSNKMKSVNEIIPLLGQNLSVITGLIDTALQSSNRSAPPAIAAMAER